VFPTPQIITAVETLSGVSLAKQVTQPKSTIPEPVPDFDAKELIFGPNDNSVAPNDGPSSLTADEVLPVVSSGDAIPSPDEYVAVEELPQLINAAEVQQATIDLYPGIAKSAGVEGTVNVKVYIGKTGDVENVIVVDGPLMLRYAATQVVKLAKFKPALQQHHPVGIWVAWPVEFSLQY
jgi:protein TonB